MVQLLSAHIVGPTICVNFTLAIAYHNLTSNSQSNARKMAPKIYKEEGGLILFLSFSNGEHERRRARYKQRNLMEYIQNYRCIFHFVRNIRQTERIIIQELKTSRHNHENDEKL